MSDDGPALPSVVPMLSYEDVRAAADWLVRAFGFQETGERYADERGTVSHAELEIGGGKVMLGWPGPDYRSPRRHSEECHLARKWSEVPYVIDGVHVVVEDVDAHAERARAAGARILSEPEDQPYGERVYRVADPEGHRWMFAQRLG